MEWIPAECQTTTLEQARGCKESGFIFEEKLDGIRAICEVGKDVNRVTGRRFSPDGTLAEIVKPHAAYLKSVRFHPHLADFVFDGELMPSGEYYIFDCLKNPANDLRNASLACRRQQLADVADFMLEHIAIVRAFDSFAALEKNGFVEGIVIKDLRDRYGYGWWKAKRIATEDVLVVSMDRDKQSAVVSCGGKVSGVPAHVQVGDCIEVEFSKQFNSGALRNGRFLRIRDDKNVRGNESGYERVSAGC